MRIDCYISTNCGSEDSLRKNVLEALAIEKIKAEVNFFRIDSEQAVAMGLSGSPSVLVDGKDIQPAEITGFSWRMFKDESGRLLNVPSIEMIRKEIRTIKQEAKMEIKVLGPGCANCHKMEELAKTAVKELGIEANIEKVSDIQEIMRYTMSTPGLVVNGKLKHSGKPLPSLEKVKELLISEI